MLLKPAFLLAAMLLGGCAAPTLVAPSAVGKPEGDLTRLVAASEGRFFGCRIQKIESAASNDPASMGGVAREEVTLPAGRYQVTLHCSNGTHIYSPAVDLVAGAGKAYRITGFFIDDSITIFNMKMKAKVTEIL